MSRLIVKELPTKVTEQKLRELFSSTGGNVTSVQLKYTKEGKFRHFAFVGEYSEMSSRTEHGQQSQHDSSPWFKVSVNSSL